MARKNVVASLAPILDELIPGEDITVRESIHGTVWEAASDEKGIAFLPMTVISTAIWFDTTRHPELVTSPPETWDDFLALVERLSADGVAIAQDGTINFYNVYWWMWSMQRHLGPGSIVALGQDAAAWDNPKVLAAAKDIEKLAKLKPFQDGFMGTKYPSAQNKWAQGEAAFNINGTWVTSEAASMAAPDAKFSSFQYPMVEGGFDVVDVGALGISVNEQSSKVDASLQFLKFLAKKEYMDRIGTDALNIPARIDSASPDALASAKQAVENASHVFKTYDQAPALVQGWWNEVLLPLDDKLLSGEITAEEFVKLGRERTERYLLSL